MSKNHTHTRKSIARTTIAAAAISAVGVLALPAPAQAAPMIPLAPACNQYGFNGSFGLAQTNNYQMWFNSTGTTAQGRALSLPVNGNQASRDSGDITGGVEGRNLNLSVRWDNGSNGIYSGTVGDDGIARGTGYDQTHPESRTSWESTKPLDCIVPATAPADTPPPPPLDRDSDGMFDDDETNGWNKGGFVTDPDNPDTDGDGVNDGAEDDNGTNPLDPNDP
jgi:hypothetical protein